MMRPFTISIAAMLLVALSGCVHADSRNQVTKEAIDAMDRLTDALATVTDKASAEQIEPKVIEFRDTMQALAARAAKLPKPSDPELQAWKTKYLAQGRASALRLNAESNRIMADAKARGEPTPRQLDEILQILQQTKIMAQGG